MPTQTTNEAEYQKYCASLKEERTKGFAVEVRKDESGRALYPNEGYLRITYDGKQWLSFLLHPGEMRKVAKALVGYLKEHEHLTPDTSKKRIVRKGKL